VQPCPRAESLSGASHSHFRIASRSHLVRISFTSRSHLNLGFNVHTRRKVTVAWHVASFRISFISQSHLARISFHILFASRYHLGLWFRIQGASQGARCRRSVHLVQSHFRMASLFASHSHLILRFTGHLTRISFASHFKVYSLGFRASHLTVRFRAQPGARGVAGQRTPSRVIVASRFKV